MDLFFYRLNVHGRKSYTLYHLVHREEHFIAHAVMRFAILLTQSMITSDVKLAITCIYSIYFGILALHSI